MKNKMIKLFRTGCLCAILLSVCISCNENLSGRTEPQITVEDNFSFGPLTKRVVVHLKSSYPWYAEASDSWISLSRNRGQALRGDSIVFTVSENDLYDQREGYIEIRLMDQMTKRIQIKQVGRSSLITLSRNTIFYNLDGGSKSMSVVTSSEWVYEMKGGDNWLTLAKESDKLNLSAQANTTGKTRMATVRLFDKSGTPGIESILKVVQQPTQQIIGVDQNDIFVPRVGKNYTVPVTSNVAYESVISGSSWITVNLPDSENGTIKDGDLTFSASENKTGEERDGYILLQAKSNTAITDTILVTQRGKGQTIYLKPGGNGDGSSWENAFGNIVTAMAALDDEGDKDMWVAKGVYTLKNRLSKKRANIYGGFNGNETKLSQRDLRNKSTLTGGAFMLLYALEARTMCYFDGFILTGTNSSNTDEGTITFYKNNALRNCIVYNNTYGKNGGGFYTDTKLINCVFYGNVTTGWSSVINTVNTEIINVTIVNNQGLNTSSGGGLRAKNCKIYNTILWGNKLKGAPFQVYLDVSGDTEFYNCAVEKQISSFNDPRSSSNCIILASDNDGGPRFISATPGSEDLKLQPNSPCCNVGLNSIISQSNLLWDIEGNSRILGNTVDMGAYEIK